MKYREFTVTPGLVGFKVKIGCTEAYFGDKDSVGKAIAAYLNDPVATENEYLKSDMRNYNAPPVDEPGRPPQEEPNWNPPPTGSIDIRR
jgi:hypothetical protein